MDLKTDNTLIDSFPFASHINSNYIPSDDEVREIKAFLSEPTRQIDELKAKVDCLYKEIAELSDRQQNLDRQVIACRSLISFPRRLPDDILREIFYQTLPTNGNAPLRTKSSPIILTQICSHWRQIALSTPTIWSTIHIPVVFNKRLLSPCFLSPDQIAPGKRHKQQAVAVSDWLKRSGTLPLHISLVGSTSTLLSPKFFDLYTQSIIPFVPRLKSLFLHGYYPWFTQLFSLPMTEFESLESLFLDFIPQSRNHPSLADLISICAESEILRSPSLRRLSVRQESIDHTLFNVDWSQLTHLALGGPSERWANSNYLSLTMASTILKSSTALIDCHLYFGSHSVVETGVLPMRLTHLQRLSILTRGNITTFVDMLDAPMLEQFEFRSVDDAQCLASLVRVDKPNRIRKLIINSGQLTKSSFLDFLRCFPGLVSLTAQHSPSIDSKHDQFDNVGGFSAFTIDNTLWFLELLSTNLGDGTEGICCPRLEEFICDYIGDFSWAGIVEFVKRKQDETVPGLAKLKKVALLKLPSTFRKGFEAAAVDKKLQPYISDGMEFRVAEEKNDHTAFENSISTALGSSSW